MADDVNRLAVLIEANTRSYENAMKKVIASTNAAERRSGASIGRLGEQFKSLSRLAGLLGLGLLARDAIAAADAYTGIQNALKITGLEGERLAAVQERLTQSALANAAPLEAMVQLYSRAALVQKELNVSSEELLRFTDNVAVALRVSGKSASESAGALQQLSQALGSGVVRAEEFNSILDGTPAIAQAAANGLEEAGGSVAKLRKLVNDGKVSSEAFFRAFEAGAGDLAAKSRKMDVTVSQAWTNMTTALVSAVGQMDGATGTTRALADAMNDLAKSIAGVDWDGMIGGAQRWYRSYAKFANALGKQIRGAAVDAMGGEGDFSHLAEFGFPEMARTTSGPGVARLPNEGVPDGFSFGVGARRTVSLSDFASPATRGSGGGHSSAREVRERADAITREMAAVRERTAAFQFEGSVVNATAREASKLRVEHELINAAIESGKTLTPELTAQISQLATAYADAEASIDSMRTASAEAAERQKEFANGMREFVGGFVSDMRNGVSAADALNNALGRLADRAVEFALNAIFGGGAMPGFGAGIGIGRRALGGPVTAGRPYVVGERGPELFVPSVAGKVAPGMGGGNKVSVQVINNAGANVSTKGSGMPGDPLKIIIGEAAKAAGQMYGLKRPATAV